jgi:hypothetical protein
MQTAFDAEVFFAGCGSDSDEGLWTPSKRAVATQNHAREASLVVDASFKRN